MGMYWMIPDHLKDLIRSTLPERVDFEYYDEEREHIGIGVEDDHGVLLWVLVRYGCEGNDDERTPYRHCDMREQAIIYRETAENLHKQRQEEARMVAIGKAVMEAMRGKS